MAGSIWYGVPPGLWKNFYDPRPPRYDLDTTFGMMGFTRARHQYCRWELVLDDIEVWAGVDFEGVMFTAHRIPKRDFDGFELLAPLRLQMQDVAKIIARIYCEFHPTCIPKDVKWANQKIERVGYMRPWMRVPRAPFRDLLKRFGDPARVDESQDAKVWLGREKALIDADALCVRIGNDTLTLPAIGAWVGAVLVDAKRLLGLLECRFRRTEIAISSRPEYLIVGHRAIPATWIGDEEPDGKVPVGAT